MIRLVALLAAWLLFGCAERMPTQVTFHAAGYPEKLSEWGLFTVGGGRIAPHPGMVTYELAAPLFSDYAQKWRTVWTPKGTPARWKPDAAFDFPVGTIVSKTFYYTVPAGTADPQASADVEKVTDATYQSGVDGLDTTRVRLVETRLLVRREAGWVAIPYVWDADGRDATLERTGASVPLTFHDGAKATRFTYAVPNQNQCGGCHVQDFRTRAVEPIGLKSRHLDRDFIGIGGEVNQLRRLASLGYLTGVPAQRRVANVDWSDERLPLPGRARAYLDINCSHCHSQAGAARTSGLWLDARTNDPRQLGTCKPPVAAGRGTGDRGFAVVPGHPELSILTYRMESTDAGEMMPELGRALVHREGSALVARYIAAMTGKCERVGL